MVADESDLLLKWLSSLETLLFPFAFSLLVCFITLYFFLSFSFSSLPLPVEKLPSYYRSPIYVFLLHSYVIGDRMRFANSTKQLNAPVDIINL